MRILLDTQAWLWMVSAPHRLSQPARELLGSHENELLLSVASAWEMAIKQSIGKLTLEEPAERFVPSRAAIFRTSSLALEEGHALRVATLPAHHRDPFDRLLIAQAQINGLDILTADPVFSRYDVRVIAAA